MWMQRREIVHAPAQSIAREPSIIALIDAGLGQDRLSETMRCLEEEGIPGLLIGGQDVPDIAEAARRIDWNSQPWLMPIVAGDVVSSGAANRYIAATKGSGALIAYADDDLLDEGGRRVAPHFKPGWNRELFRHFDYLTGSCIVRASPELLAKLPRDGWMTRLVSVLTEIGTPVHVPHVLHHRRSRPKPHLPPSPEVIRDVQPSVSVIIPTRNRLDLLRPCIEGLSKTEYPNLNIIVVDNDSDDPATLAYLANLESAGCRLLHHSGPFNFSAINNRAAEEARGQLICLLNNDVEVIEPDWLSIMVSQALRDDVGAVGAQLLYPDGRIQHAGVVLGICGGAAHAHRFMLPNESGYFQRHQLPQFVSAVTAACMVVRRERFQAVGGFDAHNFPVAFNDVDLCMRLNQQGWQSLYEPRARLIHHESVSRGQDSAPAEASRFAGELDALGRLWVGNAMVDPYHHPELSPYSERFVVRL